MLNLDKLLSKLKREEREKIELLTKAIISLNWRGLDVKKLKGHWNIFRVRKGKLRVIFKKDKKDIFVLAIERRKEDTYKFK